jgi:hypothetical protein
MGSFKNLTGQRFGKLTVIKQAESKLRSNGRPAVMWECKCDCGNTAIVRANMLSSGNTKGCGCGRKVPKYNNIKDLTGRKFGKLTVLELAKHRTAKRGVSKVFWKCKCDCGNIKDVWVRSLTDGHTKSCGCLKNESQNGKSGCPGVIYDKRRGSWLAQIKIKQRQYYLCESKDIEKAIAMRKEAEKHKNVDFEEWCQNIKKIEKCK